MANTNTPSQPAAYGTNAGHYTRPPPAYGGDQSPLLGSPRTSEDNVRPLDISAKSYHVLKAPFRFPMTSNTLPQSRKRPSTSATPLSVKSTQS